MEKKNPAQELAEMSHLFLSSSEQDKPPGETVFALKGTSSGQAADGCEVEETVNVRKRIAYPATENAQEKIKRCLFNYLEENYVICRVDLKKTADVQKPRNKKSTQEEICIFVKDGPS